MKVIFCAHDIPNYIGGPNTWLQRLLPDLRKLGIDGRVLFQTLGEPDECPTVNYMREHGFGLAATRWLPYGEDRVRWVLQKVVEDPPDIFVPNLSVPAFYASRWIKEAGIPTVGVIYSYDSFYRGIQDVFISGDPSYRLSALVCVSRYLKEWVLQRRPNGVSVRKIPCGVPLPARFAEPAANLFRVAYVGRLVEEAKRISDVTRGLCRVVKEIPKTEAAIFGDGVARPEVEKILAEQGNGYPVRLMDQVIFDEIQTHLSDFHVIVLLSDYEGLPIALMEGMASGLVPVCLDIPGGVRELVEDGITGLLVKDRGDDLVSAVAKLRSDPDLWTRLSRGARAKIEKEYTIKTSALKCQELFQELTQEAFPRQQFSLPIPKTIKLPPLHPGLSREDNRKPPFLQLVWRKLRKLIKKILFD